MICILEPYTDQALTGNSRFVMELCAAGGGRIRSCKLNLCEVDGSVRQRGETFLMSASWLQECHDYTRIRELDFDGFLVRADDVVASKRISLHFPNCPVLKLEPGIDKRLRTLSPQPREQDRLRLLTVANIRPRAALRETAQFLKALSDRGLLWHWYIVGAAADEDYLDDLTDLFDEYQWQDEVSLVGEYTMEQQLRLYLNMDVALHLASSESVGSALREATFLGLPVVATAKLATAKLFETDSEALIVSPALVLTDVEQAHAFLFRYTHLRSNLRMNRRDHPQFLRSWNQAANELCLNAETLWD